MPDAPIAIPGDAAQTAYTQCPICHAYTVAVTAKPGDTPESVQIAPDACYTNLPTHTQQSYLFHVNRYLREGKWKGSHAGTE